MGIFFLKLRKYSGFADTGITVDQQYFLLCEGFLKLALDLNMILKIHIRRFHKRKLHTVQCNSIP